MFGVQCLVCGVWAQRARGQACTASSWTGRITGAPCPGWVPRMITGHSSLVAEDEGSTGGPSDSGYGPRVRKGLQKL